MTGGQGDGANDMNVCSSFCVSLRKPLFALLFVHLAIIPPSPDDAQSRSGDACADRDTHDAMAVARWGGAHWRAGE